MGKQKLQRHFGNYKVLTVYNFHLIRMDIVVLVTFHGMDTCSSWIGLWTLGVVNYPRRKRKAHLDLIQGRKKSQYGGYISCGTSFIPGGLIVAHHHHLGGTLKVKCLSKKTIREICVAPKELLSFQ